MLRLLELGNSLISLNVFIKYYFILKNNIFIGLKIFIFFSI